MKQRLFIIGLLSLLTLRLSAQIVNQSSLFVSAGTQFAAKESFTNSGTVVNNGVMSFSADLTNTSIFDGAQGEVQLMSSTTQTVGGTTGFTVRTLTLQNTAVGQSIILALPVSVTQAVNFTDGILKTDATNLLILADNAQALSASNASHVVGPVRKVGNDNFTFPLGNGVTYRPASIAPQGTIADAYTAQYNESPPSLSANVTSCLQAISDKEYWQIDHTTGSGSATIGLAYQNVATSSQITGSPTLRVARLNGSQWEPLSCSANGGTSLSLVLTDGTTSAFGTFTLGRLSPSDLSPTLYLPQANFDASGTEATRNFTMTLAEVGGQSTGGAPIIVTLTAPVGYTLSFTNSLTSINVTEGDANPVTVDNSHWTVTDNQENRQLTLTINAGQSIPVSSQINLGFSMTRTSANSGSTSNITINVRNDSSNTYDSSPGNNVYARIIMGL